MKTQDNLQEIPYIRTDGKAKRATVIPVGFSLVDLSNEEIQVIGYLTNASDGMTPIFAKQHYDRTLEMFGALLDLESVVDGSVLQALGEYNTLFAARNSPWSSTDGLGIRFPLNRDQVPKKHPLREFTELLIHGVQAPVGRSFYPVGITDKEIDGLEDALRVNSSVIQNNDGILRVILHEERFKAELNPVITALQQARFTTTNESLQRYITAKIDELRTGSLEAREVSNHTWLKLDGPLDFIIGTAVESYLDKVKGVRSSAQSVVCRVNETYQEFCRTFMGILPELEQRAPWEHKKTIDISNMPQLRFVDVATWSGGYDIFPATVVAESLPNEQSFRQKYGSVNLVFANVQEALGKTGGSKLMKEKFIPAFDLEKYGDLISEMGLKMTAAHEIGHASGGVVIDTEPNDHFGKEYSRMEEARAELFSMWVLPILVEKGLITPDQRIAGYYSMALSIIKALQMTPTDHSGSRNMMFNYFMEKGGLVEIEEGGLKYLVNPDAMQSAASDMLGIMGNIRATGDRDGLERFKSKYLSDSRKSEFERRLEEMPQGSLLVFPTIQRNGDGLTSCLVYPTTFRNQTRTLNNFV